jgi:3-phytase
MGTMMRTMRVTLMLSLALLGGCAGHLREAQPTTVNDSLEAAPVEPVIVEAFVTSPANSDNFDSPAVWHASNGDVRVYVTAKSADTIRVFDGETGAKLGSFGRTGRAVGEFRRPNGIFVTDDLLFVVERDGHRAQAFRLPQLQPLGAFGADVLKKPYGLWIHPLGERRYRVYVTDDWAAPETLDAEAAKTVYTFEVTDAARFSATDHGAFGESAGPGRLRVVESIYGDANHDNLLVADEFEGDGSRLKRFDLAGHARDGDVGVGIYRHQAEGFALYACADGSGYWIGSDQSPNDQRYLVFDRNRFDYLGAVRPAVANRTDGVWLDQRASARFPAGALYVSHSDNALAAFDWRDIAKALQLRSDCVR